MVQPTMSALFLLSSSKNRCLLLTMTFAMANMPSKTKGQEVEINPDCGTKLVCGSTVCWDANVAECIDGTTCQLQSPLPEAFQTLVDGGLTTLEQLEKDSCGIAKNACDGTLYDTDEFYCVNETDIVAKDTVLPCGISNVTIYCHTDQACSESESGDDPTCEDISTLCGDRDKETLCSTDGESSDEYYSVLLTKEKTGNLQFQGESATWGIGSFSLDHICDVDCSLESTEAPMTSGATSNCLRITGCFILSTTAAVLVNLLFA